MFKLSSKFLIFVCFIILSIFYNSIMMHSQNINNLSDISNNRITKYYREEIYLEGLLFYPVFIQNETQIIQREESYNTIINHYNEPFTEPFEKIYLKPIVKYFEQWNFYNKKGVNEIQKNNLIDNYSKNNYFVVAYYHPITSRIIRIENHLNNRLTEAYIYNKQKNIVYKFIFSKNNTLASTIRYKYNKKEQLIKKETYEKETLKKYKSYEYYENNNKKTERTYSYEGIPNGEWIYYNELEYITKKEIYNKGIFNLYILFDYYDSGIIRKKSYYNNKGKLIKYWERSNNNIYYYDSENKKINWNLFINIK